MHKPIQLAVADDDALIVQLLTDGLNKQKGMEVVLTASSGDELLEHMTEAQSLPDILVLDLKMKNGDGLEVLNQMAQIERFESIRTIVMSSFYKPAYLGQMLKLGAAAFVSKDISFDELVHVIQEVQNKGHFFAEEQVDVMRSQLSTKTPEFSLHTKDHLSDRETQVLKLICQQRTAREIAESLFVSTKTVEAHKSSLLAKTGAKNTAGLIIYAVQQRIVLPEEMLILN